MWFVHRVIKIRQKHPHILPTVECILKYGKNKITVVGWLPCHHSNVGYTLVIDNNKIMAIENMVCTRKKSTIPKIRSQCYIDMAEKSYNNIALWTVAVMYPIAEIFKMVNIGTVFQLLTSNIENVCRRGFPHAVYLYNAKMAKQSIINGLVQMGELPYDDFKGFETRMAWQLQTRYSTASFQKPSEHVDKFDELVEQDNKWTTRREFETTRTLATALTPQNTELILGSLSPQFVPPRASILVRNAEDAYRAQCHLDWGYADIYMMDTKQSYYNNYNLALGLVKKLPKNMPHLFVAWSHLWGIEDWTALVATNPQSYTCVGRLDQFPSGRGQVFRDMVESQHFNTTTTLHKMTTNVIMIDIDQEDIPNLVAQVKHKHKTVQCFADDHVVASIDTKRIQLFNPLRIRTLRDRQETPDIKFPRLPLMEEYFTNIHCTHINKSVISIRGFNGVHVRAAVYICSQHTTPFDIRVAQTHAREALYVVNCQHNLFLLEKKCKKRTTISLF